jgi:hypothetical protein
MVMEVDERQLPVEIDKINDKHWQLPMALDRDVNSFQTLINQIRN